MVRAHVHIYECRASVVSQCGHVWPGYTLTSSRAATVAASADFAAKMSGVTPGGLEQARSTSARFSASSATQSCAHNGEAGSGEGGMSCKVIGWMAGRGE